MTNPIRARRLQRRLTQEQLAERAKVSVRTVQRVEAGSVTPSWDTLEALGQVLEVKPEELTTMHEMPEPVKQALRKIDEALHELSEYMYEHPEEIVKFGATHGTYVFQPLGLPAEVHHLVCGESLPFHHAHLVEQRGLRKEMGENPDGSGSPWIKRLCPGPTVSALINVDPWRPSTWRATEDFTLTSVGDQLGSPFKGRVERIDVKAGDQVELVHSEACSPFLYEFGTGVRLVQVGEALVWTEFDHTALPVVPVLGHERSAWRVPRGLE